MNNYSPSPFDCVSASRLSFLGKDMTSIKLQDRCHDA